MSDIVGIVNRVDTQKTLANHLEELRDLFERKQVGTEIYLFVLKP
jgi:hypothetical protein